jgi:hypothetical protein
VSLSLVHLDMLDFQHWQESGATRPWAQAVRKDPL